MTAKSKRSIKRARKRRPSVKNVAKQAAKAGLTVTSIEYKLDGTVTYHTGKPTLDTAISVNDNEDDGPSVDPRWN